ncbi:response regulator [Chitinimonas sp. BJYL2]|uniref:response regulator n=1 Tax=Chitinimonas sp. BJYL2 TaxID=2976696 RepID=UPI0022B493D3|nr:response regulator [Chitinimonas sp. BJYL2]
MQPDQVSLLLVEHDPLLRAALRSQLQAEGYSRIHEARDADAALDVLKQTACHLIISELDLPGRSGLAMLETMRIDEALADMPIILMSGELDRHSAQQAIRLGISDLLIKPFKTVDLLSRVDRVVKRESATIYKRRVAVEDKPTLLVVDDTPDNLQLIAGLFRDQYKVKLAHNGEKALAICQGGTPPDLVLLDVMMPGMNGFEVARRLRAHHASAYTPIIFVTALTDDASRDEGMEIGAVDYVTKPINPGLLKLRVTNLMRYVEHRQELQREFDQLTELAGLRGQLRLMLGEQLPAALSRARAAPSTPECHAAIDEAQTLLTQAQQVLQPGWDEA